MKNNTFLHIFNRLFFKHMLRYVHFFPALNKTNDENKLLYLQQKEAILTGGVTMLLI